MAQNKLHASHPDRPAYDAAVARYGAAKRLRDAAPDMLAALNKLDAWWTATFPEGPDGDRSYLGGLGTLSDDTVELWREIRAAISKAEAVR